MKTATFAAVTVELVEGDITKQPDVEAVVNAANAELLPGGGVAGAIHRAAGPGLTEECRPLAPIEPGDCVLTGGHQLPNAHVIHCLGPIYGVDEPAQQLLASCYRNALLLGDRRGLKSIAFPAISTGAFGYPMRDAAGVALRSIADTAPQLESITRVRLVVIDETAAQAHEDVLAKLSNGQ